MGFVVGDNKGIKLTLTNEGKKAMLEKGLDDSIRFFTINDDEIIYTLDTHPKVLDVNGNNTTTTLNNKTAYKYNLK